MAKVLTIVGARPQFIKAAAVTRAIRNATGITEVMVHTGQHFDAAMSDIFFSELEIPKPQHHLAIHGGNHGDMTGRMLSALEPVMIAESPDWVLVYGDTNSTLAGALAAAKLNIPIAHVEAGLRSFNRRMPEEINRVVADHLSALHFCPTVTAVGNLAKEGISKGVSHVGDVMYDATLHASQSAVAKSTILDQIGLAPKTFALATVHRAENTDDPAALRTVIDYLSQQARSCSVVLPLHPRTRNAAEKFGISLAALKVIAPVGYIDMHRLLSCAQGVFTDSGGVQKEAYFHRVPCVTMRTETEWVETITHGWNRLWDQPEFAPRREIGEYGDGKSADAIIAALLVAR